MSAYPASTNSYLELLEQVGQALDVPSWNKNRASALEMRRVAKVMKHAEHRLVTEHGLAAWGLDRFESEFLGRSVAKISAVVGTGFQTELVDRLRRDFRQASVRVAADQTTEIECLREIGFVPVDGLVTLGGIIGEHTVSEDVRLVRADDADALSAISAEAFTNGRYMCDPWIKKEEGRRLYGEWARNAAIGAYGDATFVAGYQPSAFLVAQTRNDLPEKCGVIALVAVAEQARGQGLGAKLVETAKSWMATHGCNYLIVGTQTANEAAQSFYTGIGLDEIGRSATLAWGQD